MSPADDGHDDEIPSREEIQDRLNPGIELTHDEIPSREEIQDRLNPRIELSHDETPSREEIQDRLNPRVDFQDDDDDDSSGCLPSPFVLWLMLAIVLAVAVLFIGLAVGGVFSSDSHHTATPTTHASSLGSTCSNPTECLTSGSTLPPSAPKIITQPYSQTCSRGSSFTISDTVSGIPLPTHHGNNR
jgi:hypothetical protein